MTFQREYLDQVRRTEGAVLSMEHFRELGKYDALLLQIRDVVKEAAKTQGKLSLYPPGQETVTALIQNCHILNTALENINDLLSNFNKNDAKNNN